MSIYTEIAEEIGRIVTEKNAAYGSSFAKAGEFLQLLYPHGLSVDEFKTALLLVRVFDKQMRVATDADAFGESPFLDIAGYGILGVSLHHERKEAEAQKHLIAHQANAAERKECASKPQTPSASAPAPVADGTRPVTGSFAAPAAAATTTTSANGPSANDSAGSSSRQPASSSPSAASTAASVSAATASAASGGEGRAPEHKPCTICGRTITGKPLRVLCIDFQTGRPVVLSVCSPTCKSALCKVLS